jgi:hypothetical protein
LTVAVLDAPEDADRVFYAAAGKPLVTAAQAAKQLGWQPTYGSLRDGIAEYASAYRNFLAGNK